MRAVWARAEPVSYAGRHYQLPYQGGTGLGKPLKPTIHPLRPDIPVLLSAEGPKNVALAAEIADGWLPFWFSPKADAYYRTALAEGFARPGARHGAAGFEVANPVPLVENDDVEAAPAVVKPALALYIGGMGSRDVNFHRDVFVRMGWGDLCAEVTALYLGGRRQEAAAAIPTELVNDVALIGPADKIVEDIERSWRPTCTTTLVLSGWPRPDTRQRIIDAIRG